MPSASEVLKMSARMGAISLWSSFKIREERVSGPTALPGLSFESCFAIPLTVMVISCMSMRRLLYFHGRNSSVM